MFGPITHEENKNLLDLNARETGLLIPLVIFMIWIGVRPVDFTKYSENWVETYISLSEEKGIAVLEETNIDDIPDWTADLYEINGDIKQEGQLVNIGEER